MSDEKLRDLNLENKLGNHWPKDWKMDNSKWQVQLHPKELSNLAFLVALKKTMLESIACKDHWNGWSTQEGWQWDQRVIEFKCATSEDYAEVVAYNDNVDVIAQDQTGMTLETRKDYSPWWHARNWGGSMLHLMWGVVTCRMTIFTVADSLWMIAITLGDRQTSETPWNNQVRKSARLIINSLTRRRINPSMCCDMISEASGTIQKHQSSFLALITRWTTEK